MAEIPTKEQLGVVQPREARPFVAGPRDPVPQALMQAGGVLQDISVQLERKAEENKAEALKAQEFQAEGNFINFQQQRDQALAQAGDAAEGAAVGLTTQVDNDYDAAAREFMKTVPDELKGVYDNKLLRLRNNVFESADKFERQKRTDYYSTEIDKTTRNAALIVREDPSKLEEQINSLNEFIGKSGLQPDTKKDLVRKMQPALVAEAIKGKTDQGDYAGARELLDKYVTAATKRGVAATSKEGGAGNVVDRIIQVESGGKADAKAKTSTATGAGQFIESTWLEMIYSKRPDLAKGKSREQILALRTNPDLSREMTAYLAEDNAKALQSAGHKPTAGNVYLAHFLGPSASGGAIGILNADNDTPLSEVLGPDKIAANSFLKGKTVGWLKNWANKRMGDSTAVIDIGPKWVESLEADIAQREQKAATTLSNETKGAYQLAIATDPSTVSEAEIVNNDLLTLGTRAQLVKELRTANKERRDLATGLRNLQVGPGAFNPYDANSRKEVDAVFKNTTDQNINNPQTQQEVLQIVQQSGVVPRGVMNALRSGMNSDNVQEVITAASLASSYYGVSSRSFDGADGSEKLINAATDWNHLTRTLGLSDQRAAEQLIGARQPKTAAEYKQLDTLSKEQVEDLSAEDIASKIQAAGGTFDYLISFTATPESGYNPSQQLEFLAEYKDLYRVNFRETGGNQELAEARTLKDIQKLYGLSEFSGDAGTLFGVEVTGSIAKFPLENYYPPIDGSYEYVRAQMVDMFNVALPGVEVEPDDILLIADTNTAVDVEAGRPPKYQIMYRTEEDGIPLVDALPGEPYFAPDMQEAQRFAAEQRAAEFERSQLLGGGVEGKFIAAIDQRGDEVIIDQTTREIVQKDETGRYKPTGDRYTRGVIVRAETGGLLIGDPERESVEAVIAREREQADRRAERRLELEKKARENMRKLGFTESPLAERFGVGDLEEAE